MIADTLHQSGLVSGIEAMRRAEVTLYFMDVYRICIIEYLKTFFCTTLLCAEYSQHSIIWTFNFATCREVVS